MVARKTRMIVISFAVRNATFLVGPFLFPMTGTGRRSRKVPCSADGCSSRCRNVWGDVRSESSTAPVRKFVIAEVYDRGSSTTNANQNWSSRWCPSCRFHKFEVRSSFIRFKDFLKIRKIA